MNGYQSKCFLMLRALALIMPGCQKEIAKDEETTNKMKKYNWENAKNTILMVEMNQTITIIHFFVHLVDCNLLE